MEGNFEWFKEHYDQIYELCGECYVVIKNKQIIQIFHLFKNAYKWVEENKLLGKVNIQYCNGNETGYASYNYTILPFDEKDEDYSELKIVQITDEYKNSQTITIKK